MREIGTARVAGFPDDFGVRFTLLRSDPAPFGNLVWFVGGHRIGREDDPTFLYPLLTELEFIESRQESAVWQDACAAPTTLVWQRLKTEGGQFKMAPIELLDDVEMFALPCGPGVRFLWSTFSVPGGVPSRLSDIMVPRRSVVATVKALRQLYDEAT